VEVCGFFCIVQYNKMVQLLALRVAEDGANYKFSAAALEIAKENPLGLGKSQLVRQFKNMG
jgi:hypothetical protein